MTEAEVPEYWIVNLVDRELVVFRCPEEGAYRDRITYRAGDRVAAEAWQDVVIEASELFPASLPAGATDRALPSTSSSSSRTGAKS